MGTTMAGVKKADRKIINLGDRFGMWTVIGEQKPYMQGVPCRCDCGTERNVEKGGLFKGISTSCGCKKIKYCTIEMGKIYGKWKVLEFSHYSNRVKYYKCMCTCEKQTIRNVRDQSLKINPGGCGCIVNRNYFVTAEDAIKGLFTSAYKDSIRWAKKRELPYELTLGEFTLIVQQRCAYSTIIPYRNIHAFSCSSQFTKSQANIKIHGIDRIDNDKGYKLGNVVACDHYVNSVKNNKPYENFISHIIKLDINPTPILIDRYTETVNFYLNQDLNKLFPLHYHVSDKENRARHFLSRKLSAFYANKKAKGRGVSLSKEQIITLMTARCIMCSRVVDTNRLKEKYIKNDENLEFLLNEIDRWDNTINSYSADNCTTLCRSCNFLKGDQSPQAVLKLINSLKQNLPNLPSTTKELLEVHSVRNTISNLISKIENKEIIDHFNEIIHLKGKLINEKIG